MADMIRPYSEIGYLVAGRIATITLSRPDQLNAFTAVMRDELIDAFDRAEPTMMYGPWLSLAGDGRFAQSPSFLPAAAHSTPARASNPGRPGPSTACRETAAVR